ncbi:hypothetical protein FOIG_07798 [Fusarium odoratissimum NRRL 54006]|uniref:Uncharacterized protein n=2 Tax=Fusarium oxysporum species complex TaxID=171631 RepID=X0JWU9_FUSO5|nr:uncharacterized protein FOIG_07798 [Fusarium odoratissimum NRRL 54006]EXM00937.1 hypothetical protein FOIG_07798 [Fusarium odoratissimum NRRL 54006]TXB99076.1 hypothetical protein FocTR4_00013141 [Fusarium oxysporum f. sp. cubense]
MTTTDGSCIDTRDFLPFDLHNRLSTGAKLTHKWFVTSLWMIFRNSIVAYVSHPPSSQNGLYTADLGHAWPGFKAPSLLKNLSILTTAVITHTLSFEGTLAAPTVC